VVAIAPPALARRRGRAFAAQRWLLAGAGPATTAPEGGLLHKCALYSLV
jgi:hypothetical protein